MKRCYGCMQLKESSPHCEHCGFDERSENRSHQLPCGTVVGGQYVLGKVLGQGGFGITYLGWDNITGQTVAVKEYFPSGFAGRDTNTKAVTSYDGQDKNTFESNKKRFLREAESLAKLWNIPQIVKVLRCFEENGTVYIAMEYVDGCDLRKYLKSKGRPLTIGETLEILGPIIEALSHVHQAELVHRDISPDNIMVLPDGSAKLLDFGAARYVENADAEKERATSTQAILKHGFAPPEQYQSHGALGPWTDVYAICATMYYCLTGKVPPEAMSRMIERKPLHWDTVPGLTSRQRSVLEKGMALTPKDRFASARELWEKLGAKKKEPKKEAPKKEKKTKPEAPPKKESRSELPKKPESKKKTADTTDRIIALIAIVLAILIGIGFFSSEKPAAGESVLPESIPHSTDVPAVETTASPTEPPLEIASLLEFEDALLGETAAVSVLSGHSAETLQWFSDDPAVASVSENGTVTANGYGMARITAQSGNQATVCTVYIDRTANVTCNYTENATGITIVNCQGSLPNELILPRKIDGRQVTAIGPGAFTARYSLTSVIIPEGVTAIMPNAFYKCSGLTAVSLPKSLSQIGEKAFFECFQLQELIFPDGLKSIGHFSFANCYNLNDIYIPQSIISIDNSAFSMFGSHKLKKATVPNTVSINPSVFPADCQIIYY